MGKRCSKKNILLSTHEQITRIRVINLVKETILEPKSNNNSLKYFVMCTKSKTFCLFDVKYFTPDRKITPTPSDDEDMAMTIVMIMIAMGKVDNGVGEIKLPHAEIKIKSQWGESGGRQSQSEVML